VPRLSVEHLGRKNRTWTDDSHPFVKQQKYGRFMFLVLLVTVAKEAQGTWFKNRNAVIKSFEIFEHSNREPFSFLRIVVETVLYFGSHNGRKMQCTSLALNVSHRRRLSVAFDVGSAPMSARSARMLRFLGKAR
jgi:hypothetical protein